MFRVSRSLLNELGPVERVVHIDTHLLESKILALFLIHKLSSRFFFQLLQRMIM